MKAPVITLILMLLLPVPAMAGVYKWVDAKGEIYYADVVPPSVSEQGHSELNDQGMTIKDVAAAPSPEQVQARQRQETLAKLRTALENHQQEQDKHLLSNYADLQELEAVFNSKLQVLAKNTRSIEERRNALLARLADVNRQLDTVTDVAQRPALESFRRGAEKTLASYEYALQENQTEQELLRQQYEKDRTRLARLLNQSPEFQPPGPSTIPVTLRAELDRQ